MDTIHLYLKELKNENSTKEESVELIKLARSGDNCAREKLIKNYLLLVVKKAREYMNMGVSLSDLISEGNMGLMVAIEKYDAEKGPFSTYAAYWIKQSIIRNCMHKKRVVRLPENISELMRSDRWKGINYREVSIDSPNEEGDTMADHIPDSSEFDFIQQENDILMKNKLERILSFLHCRDAEIVKACYGIGRDKSMEIPEVANLYNLSTTRINQILRDSLKRMRIEHENLPESNTNVVEIISAVYGMDGYTVDVTDKVVDLYRSKENIKASNRLGGDPIPGTKKILTVKFILDDTVNEKVFLEGSLVKF